MKQQKQNRKLVLVAVGLLAGTGTAVAAPTAQAGETCQLKSPDEQPGGEVAMAIHELEEAQQIDEDIWAVFVGPERLAGIEVPEGLEVVELHLTGEQLSVAHEVAASANSKTAVFAVHSEKWVKEVEERLLGGFSVNFKASVCEYSQPWS